MQESVKSGHLGSYLWLTFLLLACELGTAAGPPRVLQIDVDHVIHTLTAEIIAEGLSQAELQGDAAVVIRLDTPGGLLAATQDVIQQIISSPVPVITFVAPSGGRAASAGFMILMSGDVAAMAPATNTGAAHPVLMGGAKMDEVMKQKVENDAAAAVRAVADKRGRNSNLAEQAVLESKAFTEKEALELGLINCIADDVPSLLAKLDGTVVERFDGTEERLELAGAIVHLYELSSRQRVLLPLIDPNLAFIILILGALGIYVEFSHPGLVLPGVVGGILAIVGLMSLSLLPINWAGAALILLGVACLALEATIISGGILAVGGTAAMILGAVMLVDSDVPELSISWVTAVSATLPFAFITIFLVRLAFKSFRYKVATGPESMIGEIGETRTAINTKGRVFVHSELWNAISSNPIPRGSKVRIVAVEGLTLKVELVDTTLTSTD